MNDHKYFLFPSLFCFCLLSNSFCSELIAKKVGIANGIKVTKLTHAKTATTVTTFTHCLRPTYSRLSFKWWALRRYRTRIVAGKNETPGRSVAFLTEKNLEPESVPLIHFGVSFVLFVIACVWASSKAVAFSGERPSTFLSWHHHRSFFFLLSMTSQILTWILTTTDHRNRFLAIETSSVCVLQF